MTDFVTRRGRLYTGRPQLKPLHTHNPAVRGRSARVRNGELPYGLWESEWDPPRFLQALVSISKG